MNYGDLIRATRKALGLTQIELAERLNVSQPSVSRMENAKAGDLTAAEIVALCEALGLTWSDFEPGEAA